MRLGQDVSTGVQSEKSPASGLLWGHVLLWKGPEAPGLGRGRGQREGHLSAVLGKLETKVMLVSCFPWLGGLTIGSPPTSPDLTSLAGLE